MISKDLIYELVEQKIQGTDNYIVDIKINKDNRIQVILDSDSSITIDDCVEINRHIENQLDRETEDYELEVTSFGLNMPFKLIRQYKKHIGQEVEIVLFNGLKRKGTIVAVDGDGVLINEKTKGKGNNHKTKDIRYLFTDIKSTKVIISFK
jgi:ribosome maturation factor RimP